MGLAVGGWPCRRSGDRRTHRRGPLAGGRFRGAVPPRDDDGRGLGTVRGCPRRGLRRCRQPPHRRHTVRSHLCRGCRRSPHTGIGKEGRRAGRVRERGSHGGDGRRAGGGGRPVTPGLSPVRPGRRVSALGRHGWQPLRDDCGILPRIAWGGRHHPSPDAVETSVVFGGRVQGPGRAAVSARDRAGEPHWGGS